FLLEKAFYEIEYELAHRPDWLRVPLAGTWRIFSARLDTAGGSRAGHRCGREVTFSLESRKSISDARFFLPTIYPGRYFAVRGGLIDFGDLRPFFRSRSAAGFGT